MKKNRSLKRRVVAMMLSLALCVGAMPFSAVETRAEDTIVTNGNGGKTDVGAWFTTYNTPAFFASRFSDPNNLPVGYKALCSDGTYGIPTSSSAAEIDFQLKKMAEAGIDFILFDLTNGGLSNQFTYGMDENLAFIVDNAKLTCERIAIWNANHEWKIRYAVGVGVYLNLRATYNGSMTGATYIETQTVNGVQKQCATVGLTTELQAQAVKEQFVDNETYGQYYYQIDNKPLLVLHETGTNNQQTAWNSYTGEKIYGNYFTVRSSNSQVQSGSYGWYTKGSVQDANNCGAMNHSEVMVVNPGQCNHANGNTTPAAARENGEHYKANWDAALAQKPRIVMISSLNDYMEDTQIWPTETKDCTNEEKWSEPYQYWNMTVDYIKQLRTANGDVFPSAAERTGNLVLGASVTTNRQTDAYDVNRLTDGVIDYVRSTNDNGIASYDDAIAYFELTPGQAIRVNQVKVLTSGWERANLPLDIAVDVKYTNGIWKRVAEMHNLKYEGVKTLTFHFEAEENVAAIRVSGNKTRNNSTNFRLCEIEAYYDSTLTSESYTGTQKDTNNSYNIPEIMENLLLGKTLTGSGQIVNGDRLTDGINGYSAAFAHMNYGSYSQNDDANDVKYYAYRFDTVTPLNMIRLYRSNQETTMEPKDFVLDVCENGEWKRVAACYDFDYTHEAVHRGTGSEVTDSSIILSFETVNCTEFRISSRRTRIRDTVDAYKGATCNWKLTEIEAYYNPTVTQYTGIETADKTAYAIAPIDTPTNTALNKTVTTNGYATNTSQLSLLTDGTTSGAPIVYFNTSGATATNTKVIYFDIDLGSVQRVNRVDLTLFLEAWAGNAYGTNYMKRDPRDIAIDVLDENSCWIRVAEVHNLDYGTLSSGTKNFTNKFYFDMVQGSKIRISFNRTQVSNYMKGATGGPLVSPSEVKVYCDYGVAQEQYTGVQAATLANTEISMYLSDNHALGGTVTSNGVENATAGPFANLTNGTEYTDRSIAYYWQGGNANKTGNNIRYYEITFQKESYINQVVVDYFNNSDGINHRSKDIAIDVLKADGTYERVAERHDVTEITTQKLQLTYSFAAQKAMGIRITENNIQSVSYASASAPFLAYSEVMAYYNPSVPSTVAYTGIAKATVEGSEIPLYASKNYAEGGSVTSTNTDAGLASSYPVSRLTDGDNGKNAACGIINYVNHLASIDVTFDTAHVINEVKLFLSTYELDKLPHDLALSAKVNGQWQRVAELNEQTATDSTSYFAFRFREVNATAIKVTVTNTTNTDSTNFRLVEIEAYKNPNVSRADYTLYTDLTGELVHDDADVQEARALLLGKSSGAMDVNGDGKENVCDLIHLKKKIGSRS